MKKKFFYLLIAAVTTMGFASSCSDDDDDDNLTATEIAFSPNTLKSTHGTLPPANGQ